MLSRVHLSAIFVGLLLSQVSAWHGNGHYITAYIAQEYLARTNPDALAWANNILLPFTQMCGENLYPFVEAATWSDKIKDQGWHLLDSHHFISNPWYDQGAVPGFFEMEPNANIIFAITDDIKTLSSTKEDPYGSSKSLLGKSIALRTMIHYFGDIHQPLHAEERVTPNLPNGDMGGNLFPIKHYNNTQMDNLHFIWDEMFDNFSESIRSNLPTPLYNFIKQKGDSIMQEHPYESLKDQMIKNNNATSWGLESFAIGSTFAYKDIQPSQDLPQSYQDVGYSICRERVAIGGYRLGVTLDQIYKHINQPTLETTAWFKMMTQENKHASIQLTSQSQEAYKVNKRKQQRAVEERVATKSE